MRGSDLPDAEFKLMVMKTFARVRRTRHEQRRNFMKRKKTVFKKVPHRNHRSKNAATDLIDSTEGFKSRLVEEGISKLEDKTVGFPSSERQQKEKRMRNSENSKIVKDPILFADVQLLSHV